MRTPSACGFKLAPAGPDREPTVAMRTGALVRVTAPLDEPPGDVEPVPEVAEAPAAIVPPPAALVVPAAAAPPAVASARPPVSDVAPPADAAPAPSVLAAFCVADAPPRHADRSAWEDRLVPHAGSARHNPTSKTMLRRVITERRTSR